MKVKELIFALQNENQDADVINSRGQPVYAVRARGRSAEGDPTNIVEQIIILIDHTALEQP